MDKRAIAAGLWAEYLRVDDWCQLGDDDVHSARVAIRCCATRLGVYPEFVAMDRIASVPDTTSMRMDEMERQDPQPNSGRIEVGSTPKGRENPRCAECDCENGGADCNWIKQKEDQG